MSSYETCLVEGEFASKYIADIVISEWIEEMGRDLDLIPVRSVLLLVDFDRVAAVGYDAK